jgi:hypothetical protein
MEESFRKMLKKAVSKAAGSLATENDADGFFQHPAVD